VQPERDIPEEALRVHGLSTEKLAEAPLFGAILDEFLAFIGDAPLVIHNAEFDLKFLNAEFARAGQSALPPARGIDTIALAKRRFPGARFSLDELCRRFNIDLSVRSKHGALIDAQLLAQVYLELIGGRQARLQLAPSDGHLSGLMVVRIARPRPHALPDRLSAEEREMHARFVAGELGGDALWRWAA
jgi:DNA polymerase-3 subunit epsilon